MDEKELLKLVIKVLGELEQEGKLGAYRSAGLKASPEPERKKAYVVCEGGREGACLDFLRKAKQAGGWSFTVVTEDPGSSILDSLKKEELCANIVGAQGSEEEGIDISIYPTLKRAALCEAGLGMDSSFSSSRIRSDFENGRRVFILSAGVDPFTGKEPEFYRNMILSYIRNLGSMGIAFVESLDIIRDMCGSDGVKKEPAGAGGGAVKAAAPPAAECGSEKAKPAQRVPVQKTAAPAEGIVLRNSSNLLLAKDLRRMPEGSTVILPEKKLITPMAKDMIRKLKLRVING